jgi:hypothetical protein
MPHHNRNEAAKVHQQNIFDSLQHRLNAARAKGDEGLIRQLEREMQQVRGSSSSVRHPASAAVPSSREVAKTHQRHLRENVQRRLEVARAKGDQRLIAQLEQELQQLG